MKQLTNKNLILDLNINYNIEEFDFIIISINDYDYFFDDNYTLLQACLLNDIYLPRFCYMSKLSIVGNCRMCFIEEIKTTKPIISCSNIVENDVEIFVDTKLAVQSRQDLLELILINHPLDCPICDQGSECDLQDQFLVFGNEDSRYYEYKKRSINDKNISPLIKLSLNRCIQCGRCTRFAYEIAGVHSFNLIGRGNIHQISNYLENFFLFEMSGNIIDLCPVGALTAKLYSYSLRYWELLDIKIIDIFDNLHTLIRIDFSGLTIIRVIPASDNMIDEEWISDKTRFNFDTYLKLRILKPLFRYQNDFILLSWFLIINFIKNYFIKLVNYLTFKFRYIYINVYLSNLFNDMFNILIFKNFFNKLGCFFNFDNNINFLNQNNYFDFRKNFYINNLNFEEWENLLLININTRLEFPLINLKIKEKLTMDYIPCFLIGFSSNLNFFFFHYGNSFFAFLNFLKLNYFAIFYNNLNIVSGAINQNNINFFDKLLNIIKYLFNSYLENINIINLTFQNNISILINEINLTLKKFKFNLNVSNFLENIYNTGYSEFNINLLNFKKNKLLIYQSHHYDYFSEISTILLPVKFFYEKSFFYINLLGIVSNYKYLNYRYLLKYVKEEYKILKLLGEKFRIKITELYEDFFYKFVPKTYKNIFYNLIIFDINYNFNIDLNSFILNKNFISFINNFYMSDSVSKNSFTMINLNKFLTIINDYIYIFFFNYNKWVF